MLAAAWVAVAPASAEAVALSRASAALADASGLGERGASVRDGRPVAERRCDGDRVAVPVRRGVVEETGDLVCAAQRASSADSSSAQSGIVQLPGVKQPSATGTVADSRKFDPEKCAYVFLFVVK